MPFLHVSKVFKASSYYSEHDCQSYILYIYKHRKKNFIKIRFGTLPLPQPQYITEEMSLYKQYINKFKLLANRHSPSRKLHEKKFHIIINLRLAIKNIKTEQSKTSKTFFVRLKLYVGYTITSFRVRFNNHKSSMRKFGNGNRGICGEHFYAHFFNEGHHGIDEVQVQDKLKCLASLGLNVLNG